MKAIKHKDKWYLQSDTGYKEILLCTDDLLIKDGVQAIDDEFLEWFVKNPSCEEVELSFACLEERQCMCKSNDNCLKSGYKIIIPKEELHLYSCCKSKKECYCDKQEKVEEVAYHNCKKLGFNNTSYAAHCIQSFIEGVNWQAGRSYNEEEVLNLLILSSQNFYAQPFNVAEWFEQFKKK